MKTKRILWFLLFAFGISWITEAILYASGVVYGSPISTVFTAGVYMMSPAAAALIVKKFIYKEPMKELGLNFKEMKWKYFFGLPLVNILFCGGVALFIFLLGNMFHISEFGTFSLNPERFHARMKEIMEASGAPTPSASMSIYEKIPTSVLLIVMLVAGTLLGGIINMIFTFGEELGWRGYLYNETKHLGFWKSSLLIGTVWGLWHAPLILQGHNYPEHPILGVFMMIPFCIGLGLLMSWTRLKTNSVLAPAMLHGMVNGTPAAIMLFVYDGNDLMGNVAGTAGVLSAAFVVFMIWLLDRKNMNQQAQSF